MNEKYQHNLQQYQQERIQQINNIISNNAKHVSYCVPISNSEEYESGIVAYSQQNLSTNSFRIDPSHNLTPTLIDDSSLNVETLYYSDSKKRETVGFCVPKGPISILRESDFGSNSSGESSLIMVGSSCAIQAPMGPSPVRVPSPITVLSPHKTSSPSKLSSPSLDSTTVNLYSDSNMIATNTGCNAIDASSSMNNQNMMRYPSNLVYRANSNSNAPAVTISSMEPNLETNYESSNNSNDNCFINRYDNASGGSSVCINNCSHVLTTIDSSNYPLLSSRQSNSMTSSPDHHLLPDFGSIDPDSSVPTSSTPDVLSRISKEIIFQPNDSVTSNLWSNGEKPIILVNSGSSRKAMQDYTNLHQTGQLKSIDRNCNNGVSFSMQPLLKDDPSLPKNKVDEDLILDKISSFIQVSKSRSERRSQVFDDIVISDYNENDHSDDLSHFSDDSVNSYMSSEVGFDLNLTIKIPIKSSLTVNHTNLLNSYIKSSISTIVSPIISPHININEGTNGVSENSNADSRQMTSDGHGIDHNFNNSVAGIVGSKIPDERLRILQ